MTRTPGRKQLRLPNCISLDDLVKPESMLGMYSNTFLLEFDFLAPLLPILDHPHAKRPVPVRFFLSTPALSRAEAELAVVFSMSLDLSRSTSDP
jgi:hypothetical protein